MKEYKLKKSLRIYGNIYQKGESVKLRLEDYRNLKKNGFIETKKKKVKDGDNIGTDNN
jgi:molybdopterin converting factor small subunit|tara:strand:- start:232 stop:405 length:174 start_codon:yes stop_codon:yes gene_type:complete